MKPQKVNLSNSGQKNQSLQIEGIRKRKEIHMKHVMLVLFQSCNILVIELTCFLKFSKLSVTISNCPKRLCTP